jgi:hypothetical protein
MVIVEAATGFKNRFYERIDERTVYRRMADEYSGQVGRRLTGVDPRRPRCSAGSRLAPGEERRHVPAVMAKEERLDGDQSTACALLRSMRRGSATPERCEADHAALCAAPQRCRWLVGLGWRSAPIRTHPLRRSRTCR